MWGLFAKLLIGLAASVIYAALSYRKPEQTISAEDDVGFNKAEEGTELGKAFGTVWIDSANVAWHGDLSADPVVVTGPRRFGIVGPRSRTTVGYKYSLGVHFVPCLGPVDKLLEIKVEEKRAWRGGAAGLPNSGDLITIDQPELFGGEKREGGIVGRLSFLAGYATQLRNTYLRSILGDNIPAFRGVVSIILRRMYLGTSAYLKPWRFKIQRVYVGDGGAEQWLAPIAGIPGEFGIVVLKESSILLQMDISSRSCGFTNSNMSLSGYTSIQQTKNSVVEALTTIRDSLGSASGPINVGVAYFRHSTGGVNLDNNPGNVDPSTILSGALPVLPKRGLMVKLAVTKSDLDELIQYVQGLTVVPDTAAASLESSYFNALDFFTLTGAGDVRANYIVSSFSTQDTDAATRSIVFGINELLAGGIKGGIVLGDAPDAKETDYFLPSSLSNYGFTNMQRACIQLSSGSNEWAYYRFDGPALSPSEVSDFAGLCGNPSDVFTARLADGLDANGAQFLTLGQINTGIFSNRMFTNLTFVRTGTGEQKLFDTSTGNVVEDNLASIVGNLPVEAAGDAFLTDGQFEAGVNILNMNPAHMLREVLIARDTNGSGDADEIGPSFATAASALFAEGFGLSLFWANTSDKAAFIAEVERHVDCRIYQDRRSGLWELKLIRADYDADTLPLFDQSNVIEWGDDISWPDPSNLPNQVTVTYTAWRKDKPGSITLTNPARVQAIGKIINRKGDYPGVTSSRIASRIAQRDLSASSSPLLSGSIRVRYADPSLNLGSAIKLNNPRLGINNLVVRITELLDGDGRENAVAIKFVEDRFALPESELVEVEEVPEVIDSEALPVTDRSVEEAPYWLVATEAGQTDVDATLATAPTTGWLAATGVPPSGAAVSFQMHTDSGSGYVEQDGEWQFCPFGVIRSNLTDRADHVKLLVDSDDLAGVAIGTLARIGDEYVRIDLIEEGAWISTDYWAPPVTPVLPVSLITVGRGCLDTSPRAADAGAMMFFWEQFTDGASATFLGGQSVDVKLVTETMSGSLALTDAEVDTVTFASRAIRPYPPGKVQVGASYAAPNLWTGSLALTWTHRSRLLQIDTPFDDHTAADIGPEAGTTYRVTVRSLDIAGNPYGTALLDVGGISGTSYSLNTAAVVPPADCWGTRIEVSAERGGYASIRNRWIDVPVTVTPAMLPSGTWLDTNDLVSLYQDSNMATAVVADGNPLGRIKNQKGTIL